MRKKQKKLIACNQRKVRKALKERSEEKEPTRAWHLEVSPIPAKTNLKSLSEGKYPTQGQFF